MAARVDCHMHTIHSIDGNAGMAEMCDAAIAAGLDTIAITDHVDIGSSTPEIFARTARDSFHESGQLAALYRGRLRVARGVELGQALHNLDETMRILDGYHFDFVLGSLHNLRGEEDFYYWDYDALTDDEIDGAMRKYFAELAELVRWGGFHSLAHLTYPLRYIPAQHRSAGLSAWSSAIDDILCTAAQKGIALEINTSGLRQPIGETFPPAGIVRRFRELGGEYITLGSDAHYTDDVGKGIAEARQIAVDAGFENVAIFFEGKAALLPI